MPCRSVQDGFGKYGWVDHEGRMYQVTPCAIEQDPADKTLFVVSVRHANTVKPTTNAPDVTCPGDVVDDDRRDEVLHREEMKKFKADKKSICTIKAKSTPVTPKTVAASTGPVKERWLQLIYKKIENFLLNMAITDADPALVVKFKSMGRWPLPCQMVFVLKPPTQTQQTEA